MCKKKQTNKWSYWLFYESGINRSKFYYGLLLPRIIEFSNEEIRSNIRYKNGSRVNKRSCSFKEVWNKKEINRILWKYGLIIRHYGKRVGIYKKYNFCRSLTLRKERKLAQNGSLKLTKAYLKKNDGNYR